MGQDFKLTTSATGFLPNGLIPARDEVAVNWRRLLWSAVTVGKESWYEAARSSERARAEARMRVSMLEASLDVTTTGELRQSLVYPRLDPSEKGAISYFLGMVMAKLLAWHYLSVPWMLHVSLYGTRLRTTYAPSNRRRPDMLGWRPSSIDPASIDWLVMEAKGRSSPVSTAALAALVARGKAQVAAVTTIDGRDPAARVVAVSRYARGRLHVDLEDPEQAANGDVWLIEPEECNDLYYQPLRMLVQDGEVVTHRGVEFRTVSLGHDIVVGLSSTLLDGPQQLGTVRTPYDDDDGEAYVGPDGVLVRAYEPRWFNEEGLRSRPR